MEGFGVPNLETTPKSPNCCQLGSLARRGRGRRADFLHRLEEDPVWAIAPGKRLHNEIENHHFYPFFMGKSTN